jgi:aminoglycoside phosphotransferase (APT) family kinase protein
MSVRVPRTRVQLAELERLGSWEASAAVEQLLRDAEGLPVPSGPEVLLHGDLHVRHVLVGGGALSGVIDWGDVCVGDAAIDLALHWSFLSPAGRAAFVAEYGDIGEERLLRARVLAISLAAMLVAYARDVGHVRLERESRMGLDRTLVD